MILEWFTCEQVAATLKVDADAVRGWIASGALRATNVGSGKHKPRWRISADAVEAFTSARANRTPVSTRRRTRANVPQFV